MANPTSYTGSASYTLLSDTSFATDQSIVYTIDPTTISLTWTNSLGTTAGPPGARDTNSLAVSSIPAGFTVSLRVEYEITGNIYLDPGRTARFVLITTSTKDVSTTEVIPAVRSGSRGYWRYGTPSTYIDAQVSVVPTRYELTLASSNIVRYTAYGVNFVVHYTYSVIDGCADIGNMNAPLCRNYCLANPNADNCVTNYSAMCLHSSDPSVMTSSLCADYYAAYIKKNGSNEEIDRRLRTYCKKYSGFSELFNNPNVPGIDVQLCACHLTSRAVPDSEGTVLYRRFYEELVGRGNTFSSAAFSVQDKCLIPQCRSSPYLASEIPTGGCSVPQCFNIVNFNNNGTIDGDVKIDQSCVINNNSQDPVQHSEGFVLILVIVVIIIIVLVVVVFRSMKTQRRKYYY